MSWINLTYARPGNGKSLDSARIFFKLMKQYEKTERKYPQLPKRQLWSNMPFSKEIEKKYLDKKLFYWDTPRVFWKPELKRDIDILWDDIAIQVPSDGWKDIDPELKRLFILHRHRGIRIFANCQDYKQVDINFRRMIGKAFLVKKLIGSRDISATLPPVKHIWGLVLKRQFDPDEIEDKVKGRDVEDRDRLFGIPNFFLITKKLCKAYDTNSEIRKFIGNKLGHTEWTCENEYCNKKHIDHYKIL